MTEDNAWKCYIFSIWPCTWASRQPAICYISFSSKRYTCSFLFRVHFYSHSAIDFITFAYRLRSRRLCQETKIQFKIFQAEFELVFGTEMNCEHCTIFEGLIFGCQRNAHTSQWTELNDIKLITKWTIEIAEWQFNDWVHSLIDSDKLHGTFSHFSNESRYISI